MDFFKMSRFKRAPKTLPTKENSNSNGDGDGGELEEIHHKDPIFDAQNPISSMAEAEAEEEEEEEDDDFITNEVKRRLKELRKNSFMVLIPEEECQEEEEEDEEESSGTSNSASAENGFGFGFGFGLEGFNPGWLCGFDSLYDKYCERMLFFDRIIVPHLLCKEPLPHTHTPTATATATGSVNISKKSPRSSTNKLASTLRNLPFKRRDLDQNQSEDLDHLQPQPDQDPQPNPYETLETAYVAQLSLSWEVLHCQYAQLKLKISSQSEIGMSYSRAAQAFQQFQVLLQRFVETEPFESGSRVEIYTRLRAHLSKLLQVPNFQGLDLAGQPREESEPAIVATDLMKVLEDSILTFQLFLKKDKKKSGANLGTHSTAGSSLHQVQASLDKKEMRVKELFKKKKGWKSKSWPGSSEEVELLFALVDIKVVSRILRMAQLSKEQLLWCEEKMSKIDLSNNSKLRRDASPILFPC